MYNDTNEQIYVRNEIKVMKSAITPSTWRLIAWGFTMLGFALMGVVAYIYQPQFITTNTTLINIGIGCFIMGVICVGCATKCWHFAQDDSQIDVKTTTASSTTIRWRWLLIGCIFMLMGIQLNIYPDDLYGVLVIPLMSNLTVHGQVILYFGGMVLAIIALMGHFTVTWQIKWQRHYTILSLIVLLGFALRTWQLSTWSTRFLDELHFMDAMADIWRDDNVQILMPFSELTAFTWLFPYIQSWISTIFGTNFVGIRLISVVFGTAQLIAVYWVAKQLINQRVGLISAFVLACFPLHIHFSRIGIANIADPLFGLLAMGFLIRGLRERQQYDFVLAGASLGLTHYFYEGGRLFYTPFIILWLGWFFIFVRRRSLFYLPTRRQFILFAFAFMIVVLPIYYVWAVQDVPLTPRFDAMRDVAQQEILTDTSLNISQRISTVQDKLHIPILGLIQTADRSWFYGGSEGFILSFIVPLFTIGVARAFWNIHRVTGSLLWWWLMASIVGNALIVDSLSAPRYLVVVPALTILIAWGLDTFVQWGLYATSQRVQYIAYGVGGIILFSVQMGYYQLEHIPNFYESTTEGIPNYLDADDVILRAIDLPPDTIWFWVTNDAIWDFNIHAAHGYYGRDDLTIFTRTRASFDTRLFQLISPHQNNAFFIEPQDVGSVDILKRYFNIDPTMDGIGSPYAIPKDNQFLLYFAPAGESIERWNTQRDRDIQRFITGRESSQDTIREPEMP